MADDFTRTVRIQRPSRVAEDARGKTVWVGRVEDVELELMSTTALERVLRTDDGHTREAIEKLARGRKDGILARDTGTGVFQIVSEDELKDAREVKPARGKAEADFSFVSTRMLRLEFAPAGKDKSGGFDPYDSG